MTPRVWAEIDIAAIRDNLAAIRSFVDSQTGLMAVVKANAYGHGIEVVCRAAWQQGVTWYGVAAVSEGAAVRSLLPESSICLFVPFLPGEESEIVSVPLVPMISTREQVSLLDLECQRQKATIDVHLDLDTGMGRTGILPSEASDLSEAIIRTDTLRLTGASTHFPCADSDEALTREQVAALTRTASQLLPRGTNLILHAANSGGVAYFPESHLDLVRPGLLMYGIRPDSTSKVFKPDVTPVLALKTRIALIRELPEGHGVSYGRDCVLARRSRVATLPVGYGDGYPRGLSSLGCVLIRGRKAPILGRVCMDMTVVDVTDIHEAEVGDEVVLIGRQGENSIRVEDLAAAIETTPHDVTTRLSSRVQRIPAGI